MRATTFTANTIVTCAKRSGCPNVNYAVTHAGKIAALAGAHVEMVGAALAVAPSVPGCRSASTQRGARWQAGCSACSARSTIPSLALLAVLVQLIGLGFAPIFVALVIYAQFMLARNVVAGINGVDPAQVDAARGLGMSARRFCAR